MFKNAKLASFPRFNGQSEDRFIRVSFISPS